uniref:ATPase AAA-type core domain-containing protein n=1 Tax=viral metagenome TaxID=1070528 RepID=A0A6C0LKS2_9ZZZZ
MAAKKKILDGDAVKPVKTVRVAKAAKPEKTTKKATKAAKAAFATVAEPTDTGTCIEVVATTTVATVLSEDDTQFIKGLCGNHRIYSDILMWLRNFNYDTKISAQSCIIVAGPTSIGKSYSIHSISKYLNCEIILIDNNNCYNSQFLKDIIYKSTSSSFIQILTNNFQKKVIIVDNFDALFMSDKTINITLLKILLENKLKNIPIICISNNDIIKKIGDIKKLCVMHLLSTPSNDEITEITGTSEISKICCINSNGNLNKLFRDMNMANAVPSSPSNTSSVSDLLYSDSIENTSDINILYSTEFNRHQTKAILIKDPWMIPLKFHENLIMSLNNRLLSLNKYNEYYKSFMYIMCLYDYYMFKNNIEFCVELFASKVYYLSLFKYKKNASVASNIGNFTKMLSYLSLQKKNIKNNYNVKRFPLYQISNYHISLCNRKFISFN